MSSSFLQIASSFLKLTVLDWKPFLHSVVKVPIINHLEALRDEELEERREKRRKQLAEEEAKVSDKAKDSEDKEQNPQVGSQTWLFVDFL